EGGADRRSFIYSGVAHRNQRAFKPFPPSSPKILRTQNIQPGIYNPHPVEFETRVVAGLQHASIIPQERYTVKGQREQQPLRIDFFSSDGLQGVPLSRTANLLGGNEEIIFDQRSGRKMSYRLLFPGGYEPHQQNVHRRQKQLTRLKTALRQFKTV
ncbi:hypothetical protein PHLCEN_2v10165, partial [Hermanssonia centrifuga]